MNDRLKDYFAFTRSEQRGLISLLGLMLLAMLINLLLPALVPEKKFDATPFQKEVEQFLAEMEQADSVNSAEPARYPYDFKKGDQPVLSNFLAAPFYFDPNEISSEKWKEMGMEERVALNIIRYREKGGKFRDKEGFKKIYGMNDEIYSILEPYIRIAPVKYKTQENYPVSSQHNFSSNHENKFEKHLPEPLMVELNSADSTALLSLTGIGPSYAGRIIKYRNRLGGYYCKEQLLEIKGLDSIRFDQFKDQITIDPSLIRKIDLNMVPFKDLLRHPYFEYYLVKAIFSKKDEVKRFDSVGQIRNLPVMFEELYEKIEPYLEVR